MMAEPCLFVYIIAIESRLGENTSLVGVNGRITLGISSTPFTVYWGRSATILYRLRREVPLPAEIVAGIAS